MFVENKVPRYGMSSDKTPTVRISLKHPVPAGATLVLLRNGAEVGPVQKINDLLYQFVDTVDSGPVSYVAEVRLPGSVTEESRKYPITVLALNQAWSTGPENALGPFVVGTSGSKDWNGNYNDSFYIGVVGNVPVGTNITWEKVWHAGSDGWNEPTLEFVPADGDLPIRAKITAQYGNGNYSSGVLEVTMKVNGVPMGDKLTLVLNDLPYGYEIATWAVWSAPQGALTFEVSNLPKVGGDEYGTTFDVTVENNTNDVLAFNIYGISNVDLEARGEAYRLTPIVSKASLLRGAAQNIELYRKNGQGIFELVNTVDPTINPELISTFLLDGSIPSTDRYALVQLRRQGSFYISGQVGGDYWQGNHNGNWRATANQLTVEQQVGSSYQSSSVNITMTTPSSHDNPVMEDAGGQWSWLDDSGSLMTYGTNKFVTNQSAASVFGDGSSNPVVSLDGMADSGRVRLRWTATEGRFMRFYGDMNDVTSQPGALVNIYKLQGSQRVLVAAGMKWGISFATQLLAGEYVEFEFYATTNDRTASRFYLYLEAFNSGLNS